VLPEAPAESKESERTVRGGEEVKIRFYRFTGGKKKGKDSPPVRRDRRDDEAMGERRGEAARLLCN